MKTYMYDSYEDYLAKQKEAYDAKRDKIWVDDIAINAATDHIKYLTAPKNGMCHGVRTGQEIFYFRAYLGNDCDVVGTELNESRNKYVFQWDFNKPNPAWINKFDFVYSNSYDHAYDLNNTLDIWQNQLTDGGVLVLEHSNSHREATAWDPVGLEKEELIELLKNRFKRVRVHQNIIMGNN